MSTHEYTKSIDLPLFDLPRNFSRAPIHGATFDEAKDGKRLRSHLQRVYDALKGGDWFTLDKLAAVTGGSVQGTSARIRDLRKKPNGSHTIERRRMEGGVWLYRLS